MEDDRESRGLLEARSEIETWPAVIDHLRQLTAAGLPLPASLRKAAARAPRPQALRTVAERLEQGRSLSDAVAESGLPLVDPLRAMLEAGGRTGDFAAVLQPLLRTTQQTDRLRREYRRTLAYYLACVTLACGLGVMLLGPLARLVAGTVVSLRRDGDPIWRVTDNLIVVVLVAIPVGVAAVVLVDWLLRRGSDDRLPLDWLPPMRQLAASLAWFRWSAVLQSLVSHQVPLPAALRLAGRSAMSARAAAVSESLAGPIEAGQPLAASLGSQPRLPLLLRALLDPNAGPGGELPQRLQHAAAYFSAVAESRMGWVRLTLQVICTLTIGLGVLGYCLALFDPLVRMFAEVADPAAGV